MAAINSPFSDWVVGFDIMNVFEGFRLPESRRKDRRS
jgi:hypothetical protein